MLLANGTAISPKKIEGNEIGDIIFYKIKTCKKKPVLDILES